MAAIEVTPSTFSRQVTRVKDTIFIPLPRELWRKVGGTCACPVCKADGTAGYWDTLAIGTKKDERYDSTWTVHYPALHYVTDRIAMAYKAETVYTSDKGGE